MYKALKNVWVDVSKAAFIAASVEQETSGEWSTLNLMKLPVSVSYLWKGGVDILTDSRDIADENMAARTENTGIVT